MKTRTGDFTEKPALDVVRAWLDAVNDHDEDRVMELSDPDIEIVGPRGSGHGTELLRAWLGHARVRLLPRRSFVHNADVVVEQHGIWYSVMDGRVMGEADVASRFHCRGGRVARYARHDDLDDALRAAGLDRADEMTDAE